VTLPEALSLGTDAAHYSVGLGKWHLDPSSFVEEENVLLQGFHDFSGSLANLSRAFPDGSRQTYNRWMKWTDGVWSETTTYATTDTANDAIAQLAVLPEPWFLQVGFNAPHEPFHLPPEDLVHTSTVADPSWVRYAAMVEALDTELGRILDALSPPSRPAPPWCSCRTTAPRRGSSSHRSRARRARARPSREGSGSPWWSGAPWCVTPASRGTSWST
jgi:arylsulfatase A-like enzyme